MTAPFDLGRELRHAGNNLRQVLEANLELALDGAEADVARRLERAALAGRQIFALWDALAVLHQPGGAAPVDAAALCRKLAPLLALILRPAELTVAIGDGLPACVVDTPALAQRLIAQAIALRGSGPATLALRAAPPGAELRLGPYAEALSAA